MIYRDIEKTRFAPRLHVVPEVVYTEQLTLGGPQEQAVVQPLTAPYPEQYLYRIE